MSREPGGLPRVDLEAGRWRLRASPDPAHAADAWAMLRDPEVAQWNPAPSVVDAESGLDWLVRGADWSGDFAVWTIVDATGGLVGNCVLFRVDRDDQRRASVAYRTAPWARGQGVATAAVQAMTRWGSDALGLERLELVHAVANAASCRVAEKSGYALEGVLRGEYRDLDGIRWDAHIHGFLSHPE